jgi:hypothetical protein
MLNLPRHSYIINRQKAFDGCSFSTISPNKWTVGKSTTRKSNDFFCLIIISNLWLIHVPVDNTYLEEGMVEEQKKCKSQLVGNHDFLSQKYLHLLLWLHTTRQCMTFLWRRKKSQKERIINVTYIGTVRKWRDAILDPLPRLAESSFGQKWQSGPPFARVLFDPLCHFRPIL